MLAGACGDASAAQDFNDRCGRRTRRARLSRARARPRHGPATRGEAVVARAALRRRRARPARASNDTRSAWARSSRRSTQTMRGAGSLNRILKGERRQRIPNCVTAPRDGPRAARAAAPAPSQPQPATGRDHARRANRAARGAGAPRKPPRPSRFRATGAPAPARRDDSETRTRARPRPASTATRTCSARRK